MERKGNATDAMACTACHHHHHSAHHGGMSVWVAPAVSLLLLAVGMVAAHTGAEWFTDGYVRKIWFAVAFLPVGLPVAREAWETMRSGDYFNEFTLMVVSAVGAFAIGEYPEAVAVMLFYTIGETLQHGAVDRATRHIGQLLDTRPERARVLREGGYVEVAAADVIPGETIEVKPGGRIPLDGRLEEAEAQMDTSALTGESLPRTLRRGEEALAGMIATDRTVHLRVSRPFDQSALARILDLVHDASGRKAPTELFIRRFSRIYTPAVIVLAALVVSVPAVVSLAVPAFAYSFSEWLYRGLVFLVVSCPCALVVSVPLGYFSGIGAASRLGILFKGGNYLDAMARVNSVMFDKTGTLTTGRFDVVEVRPADSDLVGLLRLAAAAEQGSTHPVARAIVRYAESRGVELPHVENIQETSGHGVEAAIDGHSVLVGSAAFLKSRGMQVPTDTIITGAATMVVCAVDGLYAGAFWLADLLKEDAAEAIKQLHDLGVKDIGLLSGDRQEVVNAYAGRLGLTEAHGDLLPEDKARIVENKAQTPGQYVAFVGDGMNDAPVLALSNVGIAMGGLGSDAAIESADVVIETDQPSRVATAIRIGRATRTIVHQNIVGAISIKIVVLAAGALGFASLWAAVFADVGVALLAVLNSVRIFWKRFD